MPCCGVHYLRLFAALFLILSLFSSTNLSHNLGHAPQESFLAGNRREALYGHAGKAWCLYPFVLSLTFVSLFTNCAAACGATGAWVPNTGYGRRSRRNRVSGPRRSTGVASSGQSANGKGKGKGKGKGSIRFQSKPRLRVRQKSDSKSYADAVRTQVTPNWLRRIATRAYSEYKPPANKGLAIVRAKEKYKSGFRQNPPLRERNQWRKFVDRNRSLARNNYKSTSKHVQQILHTRERVWNTLPNGNKSIELLSGADALDYRGVIYALVNEDTGDYFHIELPAYIGQSSESVLQRTVMTFDKSLSARKSRWGRIMVKAFRNTDRWWSKWVIIPLCTCGSLGNVKLGLSWG